MSWFSNAFRSAGRWVVDRVEDVGNWIGSVADSAWNWVSDSVSGVPLKFFSYMATMYPSYSFGGVEYFIPNQADNDVNALMTGSKWSGSTITYALPDSRSDYEVVNPSASGFLRLSGQNEDAVHAIMASVAGYVNTGISYAGRDDANIKVAGYQPGSVISRSHGYYPGVPVYGGDTWLDTRQYSDFRKGTYAYFLTMHELGHSLGLKHSHDSADRLPRMSAQRDSTEYTVMSYNDTIDRPQTFMQYDIAALQAMYGADFTANGGNTYYTWSNVSGQMFINGQGQGETYKSRIFLTIWDGGGVDTYDMSNFSEGALIDLSPGGFSRVSRSQLADKTTYTKVNGNVYNAFQFKGDSRSLIENAFGGSGKDEIRGNQARNELKGNGGDDVLEGRGGADVLHGGDGYDFAVYWNAGSGVVASLANTWRNTGDASGDSYASIEGLQGSDHADTLEGNDSGNDLHGRSGNDKLYGLDGRDFLSGGAGDDRLYGGAGADWLHGGDGFDIVEYSGAASGVVVDRQDMGRNQGEAAGDTFLDNIEGVGGTSHADRLYDDGGSHELYGNAGHDELWGRDGNDYLEGGDGHDLLVGGAGQDLLVGGAGSDIFRFDAQPGAGNVDTVRDFMVGADLLQLTRNTFTAFANQGSVQAWQFTIGSAAATTDHRLVYNSSTGALLYDADGVGGAAQVQFATITKGLALSASSFALI